MGDSTHLNVVSIAIEGLIVKSQVGMEYGQLHFDFVVFGVDVMVLHDFGVGSPVV